MDRHHMLLGFVHWIFVSYLQIRSSYIVLCGSPASLWNSTNLISLIMEKSVFNSLQSKFSVGGCSGHVEPAQPGTVTWLIQILCLVQNETIQILDDFIKSIPIEAYLKFIRKSILTVINAATLTISKGFDGACKKRDQTRNRWEVLRS